jgi:hypothetical protein
MKKKVVAPAGRAKPRPMVRNTLARSTVTLTAAVAAPAPDIADAHQVCMETPRRYVFSILSSRMVSVSTLLIRM